MVGRGMNCTLEMHSKADSRVTRRTLQNYAMACVSRPLELPLCINFIIPWLISIQFHQSFPNFHSRIGWQAACCKQDWTLIGCFRNESVCNSANSALPALRGGRLTGVCAASSESKGQSRFSTTLLYSYSMCRFEMSHYILVTPLRKVGLEDPWARHNVLQIVLSSIKVCFTKQRQIPSNSSLVPRQEFFPAFTVYDQPTDGWGYSDHDKRLVVTIWKQIYELIVLTDLIDLDEMFSNRMSPKPPMHQSEYWSKQHIRGNNIP